MQIERAGIAQGDRQGGDRRGLRRPSTTQALLESALRKRLRGRETIADQREFQRLFRYLIGQGFESDRVMKALKAYRISWMTANEIRASFLKYFEQHGHRVVPSSPLVPGDDPTLLFTNAGMNQFKDLFLGREKRDYTRATTSQKVMRVSGKHNDLDNVGPSHRHHTFFEMLGNFSFGDYFKKEAIPFAWTLLTDVWKMPADKLVVSIFKGENGIPRDDEAYEIWRGLGVPADRILELGSDDNFWQMGDTGPCGRCSEIYFVRGGTGADPEIEIWNNVFMEFERSADGMLTPLPAPSIDTGMGLERITAVLQDKESNYDTDLFMPLLTEIGRCVGRLARHTYAGSMSPSDVSMRVVADHIRATTFLIADGVIPSNEWRGYVLRKIMRRAMRHGKQLGFTEPFLHSLVRVLDREMGDAYPELRREPRDDREDDPRRREPLRRGADRRPAAARSGDRQGARHAGSKILPGAGGVPALRHLRHPLRLHRGHRGDAGRHGRQGRVRRGDGGPARQGARRQRVRRQEGRGRSRSRAEATTATRGVGDQFEGYTSDRGHRRAGRGAVRRATAAGRGARRRTSRATSRWRGRRSISSRAARSRTPAASSTRRPARGDGRGPGAHPHRPAARAPGPRRRRARFTSATSSPPKWTPTSATRRAAITPRRTCCTRRCARCSARTSSRRARWSRRIGCGSTSCTSRRSRATSSIGSSGSSTSRSRATRR